MAPAAEETADKKIARLEAERDAFKERAAAVEERAAAAEQQNRQLRREAGRLTLKEREEEVSCWCTAGAAPRKQFWIPKGVLTTQTMISTCGK